MTENHIDITPSPRVLRTLGEIPFLPWQCIAELADNSIDAFADAQRKEILIEEKTIYVRWSGDSVAAADREFVIEDNGCGMPLSVLQNAARAGYSSNDPINNLGLFGMGFNIATARLGEKTRLLSATAESTEWIGIEIDFNQLIKSDKFNVPIIREPKKFPTEQGTRVHVSKLRGETYSQLKDKETAIRRILENIYSPLLSNSEISIYVQGKALRARNACVWAKSRYVQWQGQKVAALIEIDRDLGDAWFDLTKNAYLSRSDSADNDDKKSKNQVIESHLVMRSKRLRGWVGIQRFADPNEFGIDFIRNGRKILIQDKSLFSFANPITGTTTLEYPVELGSTVGGRIVGEIHVDYLIPTYQKNDFDKTDRNWDDTIAALRGAGPILPGLRKSLEYTDAVNAPIALLANAYRRTDKGTKNLFVEKTAAKNLHALFMQGKSEYQADDKWWDAAREHDRSKSNRGASQAQDVDDGVDASDDVDDYGPTAVTGISAEVTSPLPPSPPSKVTPEKPEHSTRDELLQRSRQHITYSKQYNYANFAGWSIKVWELTSGKIQENGISTPSMFFRDGVEGDFVYNPRHPALSQYSLDPRHFLAIYLAQSFGARDNISNIGKIYGDILLAHLQDLRVDKQGLMERAVALFDRLRDKLITALSHRAVDVLGVVHESHGEVEETVSALLSEGSLLSAFQERRPEAINCLRWVPLRTILRLVDKYPEDLFDSKVFKAPYSAIQLKDENATNRMRTESKDRIWSFLKDALWVSGQTGSPLDTGRNKDELARSSHSISFLEEELDL